MKQVNFNNQKHKLTEQDIADIMKIIGKRCRDKTKARLRSIITYGYSTIPNVGILERLIKEDKYGWQYIAGQSYPDEIRIVRETILKG